MATADDGVRPVSRTKRDGAERSGVRYTTRELSTRTLPDFEQFFSQVHGCACTVYFFGRHLSPIPGTSEQRAEQLGSGPDRSRRHFPHRELLRALELAAVLDLVRRRQAHGILV